MKFTVAGRGQLYIQSDDGFDLINLEPAKNDVDEPTAETVDKIIAVLVRVFNIPTMREMICSALAHQNLLQKEAGLSADEETEIKDFVGWLERFDEALQAIEDFNVEDGEQRRLRAVFEKAERAYEVARIELRTYEALKKSRRTGK